jgi:hypothetical protein
MKDARFLIIGDSRMRQFFNALADIAEWNAIYEWNPPVRIGAAVEKQIPILAKFCPETYFIF